MSTTPSNATGRGLSEAGFAGFSGIFGIAGDRLMAGRRILLGSVGRADCGSSFGCISNCVGEDEKLALPAGTWCKRSDSKLDSFQMQFPDRLSFSQFVLNLEDESAKMNKGEAQCLH